MTRSKQITNRKKQHVEQVACDDDVAKMAVISFREDCTNSGVWRKSKVGAMEVECFWTSTLGSLPQSLKQGHSIKRLADVQRVSDGSGVGTVALALKQMQSLGCPCWYDMMMSTNRSEDTSTDTWFVFAQTSDRGPNEVWARSVHSELYHEIGPKVLYLELDCAEHCVHLCVMSGLVAFDRSIQDNVESPFKYFAIARCLPTY